jgi:arylsulfatase B
MVLLAISVTATASLASAGEMSRPNVLVIVVDDLGYGELACLHQERVSGDIPTPHMDALAHSGVLFTAGYVTASVCSPSRAAIMTGRYQTRFGHELLPIGQQNLDPLAGMSLSERTLADELKAAGYRTGMVGKWHLGAAPGYHPLDRGFEEFFGFLNEGHFYVPPPYTGVASFLRRQELPPGAGTRWTEGDVVWSSEAGGDEPPYDADNPLLRGRRVIDEHEYLTDAMTREAIGYIDRRQREPFFLYLAYNAVHSPMQCSKAYLERFSHIKDIHRRVFAAMLANLDDGVGQVLEKIRSSGLRQRTLVFLLSDNGGPTKELTSSNAPLRGGKGDMYEGGIRLPFMVSWPGVVPAGKIDARPVSAIDIVPTALAAAGRPVPHDRAMDGADLVPFLRGQAAGQPHESLFWRMGDKAAWRQGDWKLVIYHPHNRTKQRVELFNLADDLGETTDLAPRRPEKAAELLSAWERLDREMVPPRWTPGPRR